MNRPPDVQERFDQFVSARAGQSDDSPTTSANKAVVLDYFEMWNTGDGTIADRVLDPTYFDHAHPETLGPAAFRSLVPRFQRVNPGAHIDVSFVAADEQHVAVRNTVTLSRTAEPTEGIALFRIVSGKLVEQWSWYARADRTSGPRSTRPMVEEWLSFRA